MPTVIFLQCPYGIQRRVDNAGCDSCTCYDPCEQVQCNNGTQCAIDLLPSGESLGESNYQAVCRKGNS